MKYVAVGGLVAFFGMLIGAVLAPMIWPLTPMRDANGAEVAMCGLPVLAQMFLGGFGGSLVGGVLGIAIAYRLPTPRSAAS